MTFHLTYLGFLAGLLTAPTLRRLRRGTNAPWWWCAPPTAFLWSLTGALNVPPNWLPIPLTLAWLGVALTVVDLRHRRLPNALTLPAYPVLFLLLLMSGADPLRALAGCTLFGGLHLLIHLLRPTALGGGDVKLSAPLGAVLACVSWSALPLATALASLTTVLLSRLPSRKHPPWSLPHGPGLLGSTWLLSVVAV
ncbi:peptidase A24A prepilin type IV [Actinosynnema mirum DSM 43827]|uniref:Peptidase A24A prepilin type IV n=2 Tax=Actinosynnema TaxID=40566 RepID=C6W905_ACTMD|nr:A24 family peptidase [Actinosynnema mirum]ACU39077.1 peptidase A24A prepilin type IV [Actinosynnema mirum DSM 43827]